MSDESFSASNSSPNRRVRVFVSSTFKDMMEDRDELMNQTWPKLRRICRERHVELVEVDLRWGISEEQSERKETLKLCLDEIRSCRPFFIGLLGERYGWVPDANALTPDLLQEQGWLSEAQQKSVTELEILHGVLRDPAMAPRSFFYFRNPAYARSLGSDYQAENAGAANKQDALKARIRAVCRDQKITLRENYDDPRQLARLVFRDLRRAIRIQYPSEEIPDPLVRQARDHEAFAEIRQRSYVERRTYFESLNRHAEASGPPLVVLGDSGSGKSALLANWLLQWKSQHAADFTFQHFIGGTPDSTEHWEIMLRLIREIARWTNDDSALPTSREEILRAFPLCLAKARAAAEKHGVRCVIVIDALDQLDVQDKAQHLGWLSGAAFTGPLRLFVSTAPGKTLHAVEERKWEALHIGPMDTAERRKMIADYLHRFGKKLDEQRMTRLAEAPATANPLYLKILLDELRVTGVYNRLTERLDEYLAATTTPALLQNVLARYRSHYEHDRPGLVAEALSLIWVARRGLSENEILRLLRPQDKPQLPPAIWAPLRAALEEGLVDRGGVLNFAHDFLRTAVETAFITPAAVAPLRHRLVDEFEAQPISARSCDELPWLLRQVGERARLRACLLDMDRFIEIEKRDSGELMRHWVWLGNEREMGSAYLAPFRKWCQEPRTADTLAYGASHLAFFLNTAALYTDAEPIMREVLAMAEHRLGLQHRDLVAHLNNLALLLIATGRSRDAAPLLERTLAIAEHSFGPLHTNVATALNNLAQWHCDIRDFQAAEPMMRRALEIDEREFGPEHHIVAIRLNNLAQLLRDTGRLDEAEQRMRHALEITSDSLGAHHPTVAICLNNLAQLLHATGRHEEAEPMMFQALEIDEVCLGSDHPNIAIRLANIAQLMAETDRLEDAETCMRRALAINLQALGPNHPLVAANFQNLAQILHQSDHQDESLDLARNAVEVAEAHFGPEHTQTGDYLSYLARILYERGELEASEPLMRRALKCAELDSDRLRSLALLLQDKGELTEATDLLSRALRISEQHHGPEHSSTGYGLFDLGELLYSKGELPAAERILRRAVPILGSILLADHPDVIAAKKTLARLLRDTRQYEEATLLMREITQVDTDRYGENHPIVLDDQTFLAQLAQATGGN